MAGEAVALDHAPANTPKYRRLRMSDVGVLLKLHKDGLSQVEIAQRLGCTQPTVSEWLAKCHDTTDATSQYLRGQSLRMAQNIVEKGRAADHVKVLEGIEVLKPQQVAPILNVLVGMPGQPSVLPAFASEIVEAERKPAESLGIGSGSDNPSSVNGETGS